ncbi:homoserine kinase [Pseudenhygromyxa sp. WMMC2535]|uniref:homoserine kinase n=1 Tax=Pseudenhygromyxa sp. WMMC2535 TaxID=2712867 RepID=UPI0015555962|nr:homoserine kinase [Pseudenhygromyxa sp. WMMC2535]NVB43211.1 homoserine kinase [Pseudenhygromyxa sp. WMMC2535]
MSSLGAPRPWVEAYAPATVSNLGPGFDCLGLAVSSPGDRVRARRSTSPGVRLLKIRGDQGRLSLDPAENTACVAVTTLLERIGATQLGVDLELVKGLPLGSGLGSSGASACAALVASVAALGLSVGNETMIDAAREAERVACGTPHPDNVAPAILGGIVLIAATDPLRVISLPVPDSLYLAIYTPGCEVKTADARAVLPKRVGLDAVVRQSARMGQLVHALHVGDLALLGEAIVDDLVEPARAHLIPGFLDAKVNALEAGALACTISGAGPTVFALSDDAGRAEALQEILDESFTHAGVQGTGRVEQVGAGARVISPPMH